MTVDAEVQRLIDTALAPVNVRLAKAEADLVALTGRVSDLEAARPSPTPPTPSGIPIAVDVPFGWREAIAEDFNTDCPEGQFGAIYGPRGFGFYPGPGETSPAAYGTASGGTLGYLDTSRRGTYTGRYISAAGGALKQRLLTVDGFTWVSSVIPFVKNSVSKWGSQPGMIWEECSRFTLDPSFKAAHLLWPESNRKFPDGELDWPEFGGSGNAKGYVHRQNATSDATQVVVNPNPPVAVTGWHVYRTIWTMGAAVTYLADGAAQGGLNGTGVGVPATPMRLSLQNETILDTTVAINPAHKGLVETDWIRVLVPA